MSDDSDEGDQPGETGAPVLKRAKTNHSEAGKIVSASVRIKNDGRPHSAEPNMHFELKSKKWYGQARDVLERSPKGHAKVFYTPCYSLEVDAIEAKRALEKKIEAKFWKTVKERARADPLTKDLSMAPVDAAEGVSGEVYWRANQRNKYHPHRVIRLHAGKKGFVWRQACDMCEGLADTGNNGVTLCLFHMPSGYKSYYQRMTDVIQNPNASKWSSVCSRCCNVKIGHKRQQSKGGNGLCVGCEEILKEEAAEAGAAAPPTSQSWEDYVLDKLIPLVGEPHEMRDDHKAMLGVLRQRAGVASRRRRKDRADEPDCDTNHRRRPDLLYVLRHPETGRIIVCISVEIDEHSHAERTTECELAKVDDTREALQAWGQREGFTDDRAGHGRPDIAAPFYYVFKLNPNACDCTPTVKLDARIALLAARVKAVFALDRDELLARALESESRAPIVECLFHHSAQAAHHLAAFAAEGASTNWDWRGNTTSPSQGWRR